MGGPIAARCPGCKQHRREAVAKALLRVFEGKKSIHVTYTLVRKALDMTQPAPGWVL
jgi:hypothetical protein